VEGRKLTMRYKPLGAEVKARARNWTEEEKGVDYS